MNCYKISLEKITFRMNSMHCNAIAAIHLQIRNSYYSGTDPEDSTPS